MLKNCEECGRVFSHPTRRVCEDCFRRAKEDFETVKEYLKKNPGAALVTVAQETEVDIDTIQEYIRSGRLKVIPKGVELFCELCGVRIESGRLCAKCSTELRGRPRAVPKRKQESKRESSKVHYLDEIRKKRY